MNMLIVHIKEWGGILELETRNETQTHNSDI